MIITSEALAALNTSFKLTFNEGVGSAESQWAKVAMTVPSSSSENSYAWLSQAPKVREWIGDRVVKQMAAYGYKVVNRKWESTVSVKRTDIEDDQLGIYGNLLRDLGRAAAEFPDELIFGLLSMGFSSPCYDGQNFFDTDHPLSLAGGETGLASNMQAGSDEAWYLLDTSRALRPLVYQERIKPELVSKTSATDEDAFWRDEYVYGSRQRGNAGFGLWQLAFASKVPLTAENYAAARRSMMTLRGDEGRLLGVKPTTLLVSPNLEEEGRILLNSATISASSNPWVGSANLIVSPWLAT